MAGKAVGPNDADAVATRIPSRMGLKNTRAYAEGRLAGSGTHPSEASGSPAYVAFDAGVAGVADATKQFETAVP